MAEKQYVSSETGCDVAENTGISKDSEIHNYDIVTSKQNINRQNEIIIKISQQFNYRDIKATYVKKVSATRTTTYFYELDKHRLHDIVRIDSTLRRILEIALETSGISILAPIPETSQIAVIVPEKECAPVRIESFIDDVKKHDYRIPCVAGEDYLGHPLVLDLAECHHQLLGGATGSGKSNLLRAIITTIAMTCESKQLRIILVDGKGIDLAVFNKIPHLLCPVITEKEKAVNALRWLTEEMERRRDLLQNQNLSDIWIYNQQCLCEAEDENEGPLEELPAILLIIDEVQVLMDGKNEEVEGLLRKITQQGRACGIIVILATQRPSVDIIQGSIKINLPGRIAFNLPSQIDSRVILDQPGAEILKSKGDMLVSEPPYGKVIRLQAPLVTDLEIQTLCESFDCKELENDDPDIDLSQKESANKQEMNALTVNHSNHNTILPHAEEVQNDKQIYHTPISAFARVLVQQDDIVKWLSEIYPDRIWHIKLKYFPFIYGTVREDNHFSRILYDIRNGTLVRRLLPRYTVAVDNLYRGLNGELDIFKFLRETGTKVTAAKDIIVPGSSSSVIDANIARLIGKGIIGASTRGYYVQNDFAKIPRFFDKLLLADIPEICSKQVYSSSRPTHEIDEQLRIIFWKLWQGALENHSYIGLPIYLAESKQGDTLMIVACHTIGKLKWNQWLSRQVNYCDNSIFR